MTDEQSHDLFTDAKTLFLNNKEIKSIVIDEVEGGILYEKPETEIILTSNVNTITYGESVILNGSIPFESDDIKIYQNNVLIDTVFTSNGVFSKTISGLNAGEYTFHAVFEGDENHVSGRSNGIVVTVNKVTPIVTISYNTDTIHPNETITITGTTTFDGTINFFQRVGAMYLLGNIESNNGTFTYTFTNTRNTSMQVFAIINQTNNSNQAQSNTLNFIYSKYSTNLTIEVPTLVYSDVFDVTGVLTDENDNPLTNASVKLYRDNVLESTETTNSNGRVTFHKDAPTSITSYDFQLKYDGNNYYNSSNSSVINRIVNKETSVLNITSPLNNSIYTSNELITVTGNLSDNDATPISNKTINIKENNITITTFITDSNGDFSGTINSNLLNTGENTLIFNFVEEEYYTGVTQTIIINIEEETAPTPSSLTLSATKPILSTADAFKNWTHPYTMGIDEENGLPYLTPTGSGVVLSNFTLPSEFEINYKFKTINNTTSGNALLFNIGTDVNNGILIGTEGSSRQMHIYTRVNNSNSGVAIQQNVYNYQEWTDVNIRYEDNIISITMNGETISYTLTNPDLIQNYLGVYGSGVPNARFADFEIIDLSDNHIVYSSYENTSTEITAIIFDENDNPCSDETVTFKLGLHETQTTTDNNGIATLNYSVKQLGDVPITATLNNLTDTITIEDCNYYNDGTNTHGLRINSGVSCSSDGEWIVISKSSNGEQFVFPPNPLCCFDGSDNWELSMKCKTSDYSYQALAVQINGCGYGSYSGDSQYWGYGSGEFYGYLNGNYTLLDTDKVTYKREDGYWKVYVNDNILINSKNYNWTGLRTHELYTNSGRKQSVKEWKIKRNVPINNLLLTSNKTSVDLLSDDTEVLLTANVTSMRIPLNNATITFKNGDNILGTAITNNQGIATFSWTPTTQGSYNINYEIQNISSNIKTISVTEGNPVYNTEGYLIYDNCSTNNTSNYYIKRNASNPSIVYVGEPNGIQLVSPYTSDSTGDNCFGFGKIPFYDDLEISMDIYFSSGSHTYNIVKWIQGYKNNTDTGCGVYIGTWSSSRVLRVIKNNERVGYTNPSSILGANTWWTFKTTFNNDGTVTLSIINATTGSVNLTGTYPSFTTDDVDEIELMCYVMYYERTQYIKNIKVRRTGI